MSQLRDRSLRIVQVALISLGGILLTSVGIDALSASTNQASGNYTVLAAVTPARYIIVSQDLQILEVISNTAQDVLPTVLLGSLDGQAVPYTDSVRSQYLALKRQIDFSKAGVVYKAPSGNPIGEILRSVSQRIERFIFG